MVRRWLNRSRPSARSTRATTINSLGPEERILAVLDDAAAAFTFPMLDNGYVYLAAIRLTLYRTSDDWAMAFEIAGFSPRAGFPDTSVWTFGSRIRRSKSPTDFVDDRAFRQYLAAHPNDDAEFFHPIESLDWQDEADPELVRVGAGEIRIRGRAIPIPSPGEYRERGVRLEDVTRPRTYELCRYLAAVAREDLLGTPVERRVHVPKELAEVVTLDDWRHPDVVAGERPSGSETFKQLAAVLVTGQMDRYRPSEPSNTHWSHWPEGGRL